MEPFVVMSGYFMNRYSLTFRVPSPQNGQIHQTIRWPFCGVGAEQVKPLASIPVSSCPLPNDNINERWK